MTRIQTTICIIEGCGNKPLARDLCQNHYKKWQYDQNPEKFREISNKKRTDNPSYVKWKKTYDKKYYALWKLDKDRVEKHREKRRELDRLYRIACLDYYSNYTMKCLCCGEDKYEFLSIDHEKGGGSKHRKQIGWSHLYLWLIQNDMPEGFQTLCMNCNWAKGIYGSCPHNLLHEGNNQ